jgi:putative phosphoesterase
VRLAIIADTHLPRGDRRLPESCVRRLRGADLILHAGDLTAMNVLVELEDLGPPVLAVHGNVDEPEVRRRLPPERVLEAGGARLALVHDAGPARGRMNRMRRRFPDADAVVFGHSHIPIHEEMDDFQIFNPGSPTDRRRQPRASMGIARVVEGVVSFELVYL